MCESEYKNIDLITRQTPAEKKMIVDQLIARGFCYWQSDTWRDGVKHVVRNFDIWLKHVRHLIIIAHPNRENYWLVSIYNSGGDSLTESEVAVEQTGQRVDYYEAVILKGATDEEIKNLSGAFENG